MEHTSIAQTIILASFAICATCYLFSFLLIANPVQIRPFYQPIGYNTTDNQIYKARIIPVAGPFLISPVAQEKAN